MTRIMVSAFNDQLASYGLRMYRSFHRFNKDIPMFFADFGDMGRISSLEKLGVRVLPQPHKAIPKARANFRDMLLYPYVKDWSWDRLLWVDADTLVCRPFDPLWLPNVDFAGHPDRDSSGLLLTCDYDYEHNRAMPGITWAKFATGIWVTRNVDFLKDCYVAVKEGRFGQRDSDLVTMVANGGDYSYYQLDGNLWNFSRDIVPLASYDGEHIYYKQGGRTYHPYAVGFSRVPRDGRDRRLTSRAIGQFYRERILR